MEVELLLSGEDKALLSLVGLLSPLCDGAGDARSAQASTGSPRGDTHVSLGTGAQTDRRGLVDDR